MSAIAVTGANGKAGRAVVADLIEHGYEVRATDAAGPTGSNAFVPDLFHAELTDFGSAIEALAGCEAVVHLANIPAPGHETDPLTLSRNLAANTNVFLAAQRLGLAKVVWASSETTLGLPFDTPPEYAPVDEAHFPYPTSTYALSKVMSEQAALHIAEWSGIPFVGLRFSNIHTEADYRAVPSYWADPAIRRWNLWGYVDVRDAAASCRLALEADTAGSINLIIAAADTIMDRPSRDLLADQFPTVSLTRDIGEFETLLAVGAAKDAIGYVPRHSWRGTLA